MTTTTDRGSPHLILVPNTTIRSRVLGKPLIPRFPSPLPSDTVLDCILDENWKENGVLHVLDVIKWKGQDIADCESSFRLVLALFFFIFPWVTFWPPATPHPTPPGARGAQLLVARYPFVRAANLAASKDVGVGVGASHRLDAGRQQHFRRVPLPISYDVSANPVLHQHDFRSLPQHHHPARPLISPSPGFRPRRTQ
jgi:hypothetical protein